MADTDTDTLPNGTGALSEEDERLKQRPADIDADVREMERRKRVEALMSSKMFREELERVLDQQLNEGNDAPLLQRIREMVGGRLHTGSFRGPSCVLPINDIRGIEGVGYEKGEKILRCKLAAVYRLVDLFGWTQTGISGQITARLNTAVEQVLTTPRGLLPHEVTASSLVKVDMQGVVQDQGTTNFPVNAEGFSLHASVHAARPDVRCVLHIRSPAALAVSSMKRGLLPLCNEAALLGDIAYHRVPYGNLDNEERDKLVRALGPHAKVLMLSSGGALCCGGTLEEAFFQARNLTAACDVQLRLASLPLDELAVLDEDTRRQIFECSRKPPSDSSKWRVGGEEFEALMRMLDNAGFRTGYIYRHPLVKHDVPKPKNDVEVPPAVSSLGYLFEEEELYRQGIWKKGQGGPRGERTRWLNSPNVYQKVEVLETGTTDPRKITKWVDANNEEWVQDGSPAHSSTPVKIDTLTFVPKNTNPKEFKQLQQQIKDYRRADKISAGPQSHILEGVTWDEASKLVGEDAANTHTGDHVVLMGAASKGIIQRGYQHNATMYSAPYARNPFDHVTDREIDEYRRIVERKQRSDYDTDLSESEAISAAQITSPASAPSETEEESRDEHRVLRIETKQVPVRSQPEVVLSDVDTTDFLNAERAHADRTKVSERDPNLLPDDEVFLDSATSSVSPPPPGPVVIRAQHTAVQQTVVRGKITQEANPRTEALSTSKRFVHDYSRTTNFDKFTKKFDSIENDTKKSHPKCKVSLNSRLISTDAKCAALDSCNPGISSSRSSLYSIPSIEWDGRHRSDFALRTRSLPRQRVKNTNKLFRTRSHSGFINAYLKDPEPTHYHLPRCRSCGATNSSYAWELTREESSKKQKFPSSFYLSADNIPQKYKEELDSNPNVVKVTEKVVPLFKIATIDTEFVESQEFNEDNYLGDIGTSFSSENQTIVETKPSTEEQGTTLTKKTVKVDNTCENEKAKVNEEPGIYRAECVPVLPEATNEGEDVNNNTIESVEGEYHSFTDEMDFEEVYVSPVKELVGKDIRDYSVPINFYCEDYGNKEGSPQKSPQKRRQNTKNILEPISEESKSSYGDDSSNLSTNKSSEFGKIDKDTTETSETEKDEDTVKEQLVKIADNQGPKTVKDLEESPVEIVNEGHVHKFNDIQFDPEVDVENVVQDLFTRVMTTVHLKREIFTSNPNKITTDLLEMEYIHNKQESYFITEEGSDITTNDVESVSTYAVQTAMEIYSEMEVEEAEVEEEVLESVYDNVFQILSTEAVSTTVTEANKIDHNSAKMRSSSIASVASSGYEPRSFDSTGEFETYEIISDVLAYILNIIDYNDVNNFNNDIFLNLPKQRKINFDIERDDELKLDLLYDQCVEMPFHHVADTVSQSDTNTDTDTKFSSIEDFSIAKIIQDMECKNNFNDSVTTEASDSDLIQPDKVAEAILYYIFDRVFFLKADKTKTAKSKISKRVITVVDSEDILFTSKPLWTTEVDITNIDISSKQIDDNITDEQNKQIKYKFDCEFDLVHNNDTSIDIATQAEDVEECLNDVTVKENEDSLNDFENFTDSDPHNETNFIIPHVPVVFKSDTSININQHYEKSLHFDEISSGLVEVNDEINREVDVILDSSLDHFKNQLTLENEFHVTHDDLKSDIDLTEKDENCLLENENVYSVTDNENSNHLQEKTHDETYEIVADVICEVIEKSFNDEFDNCELCTEVSAQSNSETENLFGETYVLDNRNEEMDTAFLGEDSHEYYSRSSSPNKDLSILERCTESPIKNSNNTFLSEDRNVLYEKEDSILGSPFIKKASVISMSQTVNSGGMRYWISFDDSLAEIEKPTYRRIQTNEENQLPSFVTVDFKDDKNNSDPESYWEAYEKMKIRRTSVLLDSLNHSEGDSNIKNEESFTTACASDYNTCESDVSTKVESAERKKKLLYDSRIDLHTKVTKRQYASWPPFEDTLFYRIISKFRMSESFDPSEFERIKIDHSL